VVTVCCGDHRPADCCDENCTPCCPECVTCPEVHLLTVEQRAANAGVARERLMLGRVLRDRAMTLAVRSRVDSLAAGLTAHVQAAVDVAALFEPDELAAAREALADLDVPHLEGSLT
jgi:hypothetical protein